MLTISSPLFGQQLVDLEKQKWIHGSDLCSQNKDEGLQVVQYDHTTFIIRQNKCVHYEAPFIYLLIGTDKALLMDTGAEASEDSFPLYRTIANILAGVNSSNVTRLPLIVIHSHSHDDHYAGDHQFMNKPDVRVVSPTKDSIINFFHLKNWPENCTTYELGQRQISIIPIPGHDEASIAIYDPQTTSLLTGDTFYPGRLYIRDWKAFRSSIERLYEFTKANRITYLMGNHIEMTATKKVDYPTGTSFQPNEHVLPLRISVLKELHQACQEMGPHLEYSVHDDFILVPKD